MLDKNYINEQFLTYKEKYKLNKLELYWYPSCFYVNSFSPGIYINGLDKIILYDGHYNTTQMMRILLHEIAHAIQDKRGVGCLYFSNVEFTLNMEVAADKFAKKQFDRFYKDYPNDPSEGEYYVTRYYNVSNKTKTRKLKYFKKRLSFMAF